MSVAPRPRASRRRRGVRGNEQLSGWLFVLPAVLVLGLFMLVPIAMAFWVSLLDWKPTQGDPFSGAGEFVGTENYADLVIHDGLAKQDFVISIRNNFYYVLFVVPCQTALALLLAVVLNRARLRGRGFFRTAFFFPSIASSIAVSMIFLFLFLNSGAVNQVLAWVGINGPSWFNDANGVIHNLLGALHLVDTSDPPGWLVDNTMLGMSWWAWIAGPSVALCAIIILVVWTTSGTLMLLFLAALQDIPAEVDEAARIDGASHWKRFRYVTLPQLRPAMFLVLTLGLIGTWQVFDQVYVLGAGDPQKTTLTPAFLTYRSSFLSQEWGIGAATAFLLFALIIVLTLVQRAVMRERDPVPGRRRLRWFGGGRRAAG